MLDKLQFITEYAYYFQFTLNPYEQDIEAQLPAKHKIIETFKRLSDKIGPQKVIWRYDPVLLNTKYTISYHVDQFNELAGNLKGYTNKVTFSFMDFYKKISESVKAIGIKEITGAEKNIIAENFSRIAKDNDLAVDTCAEDIDLSKYDITHARCIDDRLIAQITERNFVVKKDKNQRPACGCARSIDIGEYNSCANACAYCYATYSHNTVQNNIKKHDRLSPLLIGEMNSGDIVKERKSEQS
jgi:hypothetical protein